MKKSELKQLIKEEISKALNEFDSNEYLSYLNKWGENLIKFLENKKLGNLSVKNIKSTTKGIIEFSTETSSNPPLRLDWGITNIGDNIRPEIRIEISSPNKKGTFSVKTTGKNTSNENIWKRIESIYYNQK
jgi:hypothetical protein